MVALASGGAESLHATPPLPVVHLCVVCCGRAGPAGRRGRGDSSGSVVPRAACRWHGAGAAAVGAGAGAGLGTQAEAGGWTAAR